MNNNEKDIMNQNASDLSGQSLDNGDVNSTVGDTSGAVSDFYDTAEFDIPEDIDLTITDDALDAADNAEVDEIAVGDAVPSDDSGETAGAVPEMAISDFESSPAEETEAPDEDSEPDVTMLFTKVAPASSNYEEKSVPLASAASAADKNAGQNTSKNAGNTGANHKKKNVRRRRNRLSPGKIAAICVILVIYAISVTVGGYHYLVKDEASIFDSLFAPDVEGGDNGTKKYVETIVNSDGEVETVTHILVPDEEKQKSYNILVLGHNSMLTDVFMLVNIDASTSTITIMQIPRDTWIADNNNMYITTNKINAVLPSYYNYYRASNSASDAYKMAYQSVSDTIENNLGISVDFTVIMDLEGFRSIVDVLGGVEVYVEQGLYYEDPAQGLYINIPAGHQTLNGAQAEGFVRYRAGYLTADLGRQNAQKQFLAALFSKVKSSVSITNVPQLTQLANEILTHVDTDMSATDMIYFAKEILKCDLSAMNMMTMPGNLANGYYVMNREAVKIVLSSHYYRYDGDIPDSMFDPDGIFNCPSQSNMNYAYNLPADQVYDPSVYNGENAGDIHIQRH